MLVKIPHPTQTTPLTKGIRQILKDVQLGIQAVATNRGVSQLFLYSILATICIMLLAVLFPLMTLEQFNGNAFQMSIVEASWGVGMLIGGAVLGVLKLKTNKIILINWTYILMGVAFSISGLLPPWAFWIFVFLTVLCGVTGSIYNACFTAIIQQTIDPALLGRIFSMFFSISLLPALFGLLGTGFLADHVGINNAFIFLGLAIFILGIFSFFSKKMKLLGEENHVTDIKTEA